jgi:hypothetical protein
MDILSVGAIVLLVDPEDLFPRTDRLAPVRCRKFNVLQQTVGGCRG